MMSNETTAASTYETEEVSWVGGVTAGLAGGVAFGIMLTVMMPSVIGQAIPALVGLSGIVGGWGVHLAFSAAFGLVFAAAVGAFDVPDAVGQNVGLGTGYGFVLWPVNIVVVWPLWLQMVGFPAAPAFPNVAWMPLVGHLLYGLILGFAYPFVDDL